MIQESITNNTYQTVAGYNISLIDDTSPPDAAHVWSADHVNNAINTLTTTTEKLVNKVSDVSPTAVVTANSYPTAAAVMTEFTKKLTAAFSPTSGTNAGLSTVATNGEDPANGLSFDITQINPNVGSRNEIRSYIDATSAGADVYSIELLTSTSPVNGYTWRFKANGTLTLQQTVAGVAQTELTYTPASPLPPYPTTDGPYHLSLMITSGVGTLSWAAGA